MPLTGARFEVPDESLWGKSRGLGEPYPLVRHLLDAAAMALYLWDHYLSENQRRSVAAGLGMERDARRARAVVALCAGLHDVGKISGFQLCDGDGRAGLSGALRSDVGKIGVERLGHDIAGMEAAPVVLSALGFPEGASRRSVVTRVAQVIGGHHGRFCALDRARADNPAFSALLGGVAWERQRLVHAAAVYGVLGAPEPPEVFEAPAAVLVTGVVILADWLVSQEDFICRRQQEMPTSLEEHFAQSLAAAPLLVGEAGLLPVELERGDFEQAFGLAGGPNPLQRSVMEELPAIVTAGGGRGAGILLVTAAPGDGKTETALLAEQVMAAVCGTRGLAFWLPTMATADQMHTRIAAALARQGGRGGALTLTHSMAWLSNACSDQALEMGPRVLAGDDAQGEQERWQAVMQPARWLRGPKRPLLAQFTVGTIDQALMGVLPVRHNALRLLALSGKTVIVDEAHAYDPYMQVLLGRLLNWLGAYGVPVVLLSATLPVSVSNRLIKQYLKGAGHKAKKLEDLSFPAPYPGWAYVDAASGCATAISGTRQKEQAQERRLTLQVDIEPVTRAGERSRLAVVERLLAPVTGSEGGCALVVCNTVGEAQETYTWLRDRLVEQGLGIGEVQLLHARFPGDVREERAAEITGAMGRPGPRPHRRIVVATQVVEQSLDLDADVVISDLAPLALLLQRAGRCWRHESWWAKHGRPGDRPRPAWAAERGPRLVVLDPLADGGAIPRQWGTVYPEYLLRETSQLLAERNGRPVSIPEEVQELVECVHGDRDDRFNWDKPERSAAWTAYVGEKLAQESIGQFVAIPPAAGRGAVYGLEDLHHLQGGEDEWEAATRLGADAVRLLCVYQDPRGKLTLDLAGEIPLPGTDAGGRMAAGDVRAVMRRTIPVRADWFPHDVVDAVKPPAAWSEHPMLGDLLVLRQPVADGAAQPVRIGRAGLRLDDELGLVRT
ncbi:CRISPR-associated helicase Cas3' [Streptomyces olivoreticuli]